MLSKLLHRFQPIFCTTTDTIKRSSWVVPIGAQQIQDGRRPPFWKNRLIAISLQSFDRFWWDLVQWRILDPYSRHTVKISNFWKSNMATVAILKNHKNRDISATVWPILTKFCMLAQNGPLILPLKFRISQIQDGKRSPFWKPLNYHISATVWPILMKFGTVTLTAPLPRNDH